MMVRLLLYGYCLGVVSSRKIERAAHEDVALRFLSADTHPDHDTIAAFRKRRLEALAGLFVQALLLCQQAELEQEAKEKAERQRTEAAARIAARRGQEARTGKKAGGHDPQAPDPEQAKSEAKTQRNFPAPDSRIMVDGANNGGFIQACNAQAAVDSQAQGVVAAGITQLYIATGRRKHGEKVESDNGPPPENASVKQALRHKLRTEAGPSIYKLRKAIVEPVFGQTRERRAFRRFSFRGVGSVRLEWQLLIWWGEKLIPGRLPGGDRKIERMFEASAIAKQTRSYVTQSRLMATMVVISCRLKHRAMSAGWPVRCSRKPVSWSETLMRAVVSHFGLLATLLYKGVDNNERRLQ
jgi:hypothetical protein